MVHLFRIAVVAAVLIGSTLGVWWFLSADQSARLARELAELEAEMNARVAERDAMIARLSRTHRKAVVEVLDQRRDEAGSPVETTVRFVEVDDQGRELGSMTATVPGETVFVDAWVAKFDERLVAEGHPLMGRSLILLKRIYSDRMPPAEGVPIDTPGAVPVGYAIGELAHFEKQLWAHFWDIASDPKLAGAYGVRSAQGEAVYRPMRPGDRYELSVDADGGMNLTPLTEAAERIGGQTPS